MVWKCWTDRSPERKNDGRMQGRHFGEGPGLEFVVTARAEAAKEFAAEASII